MKSLLKSILARYRDAILPRPVHSSTIKTGGPIVVAGMFRTQNGIGRAAQGCYEALKDAGLAPVAVDLSVLFNQSESEPLGTLEEMPSSQNGTLILFANPPEAKLGLLRLNMRRWRNWRIIGAWTWELPVVPSNWAHHVEHFSEIWVPSKFVASALKFKNQPSLRVVPHHVPIPRSTEHQMAVDANSPKRVQFLCMADGRSSFHRKNTLAAVEMFQLAFTDDQDVKLVIKCRNLHLYPDIATKLDDQIANDDRIEVVSETLPQSDLSALIATSHVLVSPHRSEGFGLSLAEAMAMGLPVIATGWSGNLEFMNEQNSVLLPYTLEQVDDPTGVYERDGRSVWASVSIKAGADAMVRLQQNPNLRVTLGERAKQDISGMLNSRIYKEALGSV